MQKFKNILIGGFMSVLALVWASVAKAEGASVSAEHFAQQAVAVVAKAQGMSESSYAVSCTVGTSEVSNPELTEAIGLSDCVVMNKGDVNGKEKHHYAVIFRSAHNDTTWDYQEAPVAQEDLQEGKNRIATFAMSFQGMKSASNYTWQNSGDFKRKDGTRSSYAGKGRHLVAKTTGVVHQIEGVLSEYIEVYHNEGASRGTDLYPKG